MGNQKNTTSTGAPESGAGDGRPRIKAESISVPNGGGSLGSVGESVTGAEFTGAATITIPIAHSAARNFEPTPHLSYSSGSGNGPFGLGFSLSFSAVSRRTSKGVPRYNEHDVFLLGGAELVPLSKSPRKVRETSYSVTAYAPRVQTEFERIEHWVAAGTSDFWRTIDHDNHIRVFGMTASARICDPETPSRIFTWLIEAEYDDRGNAIVYDYLAEDGAGVTAQLGERGRRQDAQKYLGAVRYGNEKPVEREGGVRPPPTGPWHFELLFDYGQYDPVLTNPSPWKPSRTWRVRPDPFSSYAAGFEIRSYRLCHHILLTHRFAALGADPVVLHLTRLHYDENPFVSRMLRYDSVGWAYDGTKPSGQRYSSETLPPLEFSWTPFALKIGKFTPLQVEDGSPLPAFSALASYEFADLDGDGAPGLLLANETSVRYWPPADDEHSDFAPPRTLASFPIERLTSGPDHRLMDVSGNGLTDLVLTGAGAPGYYEAEAPDRWTGFRPFPRAPVDLDAPENVLVDLTGDGLNDVLTVAARELRFYKGCGRDGFESANTLTRPENLPPTLEASAQTKVLFADPFGTGGQHLVRIRDGSFEVWPSLGYGIFGDKIMLPGAPRMGPTFDARRVMLADLDGSGTADLIYLEANCAQLFLNQSGNAFAAPFKLPLPTLIHDPSQVAIVDLGGRGTTTMIVSQPDPLPQHWKYEIGGGTKAYLVDGLRNNLGGTATLRYRSSTSFQLEDRRAGIPWVTRLPFPVQVVERIQHDDAVSDSRTVISYRYRHGFYDGVEREFRGFGFVERVDAETFDSFPAGEPLDHSEMQQRAEAAAPRLIRTWFHVGAWRHAKALYAQYTREFFSADTHAYAMPPDQFKWLGDTEPSDTETRRQAHVALHGQELHQEVYGLDGLPQAQIPYRVRQLRYMVEQLAARGDGPYAEFFVHELEMIDYDYERVVDDPRVTHEYVLKVSKTNGEVERSCMLSYARRAVSKPTFPAQKSLRAVLDLADYDDVTGPDTNRLGVPMEWRQLQLTGVPEPAEGYYSFVQIAKEVEDALGGTSGRGTVLFHNERYAYYADDAKTPASAGKSGAQALLRTTAIAAFSTKQLQQLFSKLLSTAELTTLVQDQGHYHLDDASGLWWVPGDVETYGDASQFFEPMQTTNPFGVTVSYRYDATTFALIATTQSAPDLQNQVVTVKLYDYQSLVPAQIEDINDNTSEVIVDALGHVIVASHYGTEMGKAKGFGKIEGLAWPQPPSTAAFVTDPAKWLGNAATVSHYDLLSWAGELSSADLAPLGGDTAALWTALVNAGYITPEGVILNAFRSLPNAAVMDLPKAFEAQRDSIYKVIADRPYETPAHFAAISAQDYPGVDHQPPQVEVDFVDGFGRTVQSKRKVPAGPLSANKPVDADRWATSAATRYDRRGHVYIRYRPFFSHGWDYIADPALAQVGVPTITQYDALEREIRVLTGKGFLRRIEYGAWSQTHADAVDTLIDSPFWKAHPNGEGLTPREWTVMQKAALSANTPRQLYTDPLGHVIARVDLDNRVATPATFTPLGLSESQATTLLGELQHGGFLDDRGALTIAFQPDKTGFSLHLSSPFTALEAKIIAAMKGLYGGRPLTTRYGRDILGQLLWSADPRLVADWSGDTGAKSFETVYALTGEILYNFSADAGKTWRIEDISGHDIFVQDSRGLRVTVAFDGLRRPQTLTVLDTTQHTTRTVEWYVYGDAMQNGTPVVANAAAYNLLGEAWRVFDPAGMRQVDGYSFGGKPMQLRQRFTANASAPIDWGATEPTSTSSLLDPTEYVQTRDYDGHGEEREATDPRGNRTSWQRDDAGFVTRILLQEKNANEIPVVSAIEYDALGRRARISWGNDIETHYTFDPLNNRVTGLQSTRKRDSQVLQDLEYVYDPVGNVGFRVDAAFATLFGSTSGATGVGEYSYDALYRLLQATAPVIKGYSPTLEREPGYTGLNLELSNGTLPSDSLEEATLNYAIDDAGNIYWTRCATPSSTWAQWLVVSDRSNRAVERSRFDGTPAPTTRPPEPTAPAAKIDPFFDAVGNQAAAEGLASFNWSYRNLMVRATTADADATTVDYRHDAQGELMRRVATRSGSSEDTLFFHGLEINRTTPDSGTAVERDRIRVFDRHSVVAEVIHEGNNSTMHYQLTDLPLSVTLQLNDKGTPSNFEAYLPYGGTAFAVTWPTAEPIDKHYRYDQQRRDQTTGLYDFGARSLAPWLARWLSPDPSGPIDGLNLYAFVTDNSTSSTDVGGHVKLKFADGTVIDIDHLQLIEALFEVAQDIENEVQKSLLTSTGTVRNMPAYEAKKRGDLMRLAFHPSLRGDPLASVAVASYVLKFGTLDITEKRLGKEKGVHGTVAVATATRPSAGMVDYAALDETTDPVAEATRLIHLFKTKAVPLGTDPNDAIIPVMAISESDRSAIGGMLAMVELYNIKYKQRTFNQAFDNGNNPFFVGAKTSGGAKALKFLSRRHRGLTIKPSQRMTRSQTGMLKDSLETFVLGLHQHRGKKPSKFQGAKTAADVRQMFRRTMFKRTFGDATAGRLANSIANSRTKRKAAVAALRKMSR